MTPARSALVLLLAFAAAAAHAASKTYGDWTLYMPDDRDGVMAMTSSDSGTTLGLVCRKDLEGCYWALSSGNSCDEGSRTVYLLNSDIGAAVVDTLCQEADSGNNYVLLKPFETVEQVVKEAKWVGIAVPLVEGRFRVLRFSLAGSNQAVDAAYKIHEALRANPGDEIL